MFRCPMGTLAGLALVACSAMACTAIVPSTAARLASFDPLTANPAVIELVVILPPGLAVSPGSARLELSADRGTERRSGSFQLADRAIPPGMDLPAGATARGFAIAGADVARMRALQAGIAAWKAKGEARGTLGLGIGGCAIGEGPAPEATGSVLIRLGAGGPYLPLVADGRLSDLLGPDVLAAIKPCQGAE
ncbi:MAG: hypothetical protein KBF85_01125 [Tabrizicola sp.]|uniref:hypothetical protein n=1 Tax=Tabrizicola sp. TaxID=2005166 RepID=UPI001B777733|nr:hypothetical protein [Tabrizicola sp.]